MFKSPGSTSAYKSRKIYKDTFQRGKTQLVLYVGGYYCHTVTMSLQQISKDKYLVLLELNSVQSSISSPLFSVEEGEGSRILTKKTIRHGRGKFLYEVGGGEELGKRGHPIKLIEINRISNFHQLQNDSFCHLDFGHSFFKFASQITLALYICLVSLYKRVFIHCLSVHKSTF